MYLRALQGNSGCNLIDPTFQDNVILPSGFFQYIHLVGCAINLHSIINSGLIPGGQKFEQQTEYESFHERTGQPVVMGQPSFSLVLSAIKTEVPFDSDDPAYQNFLLPQF